MTTFPMISQESSVAGELRRQNQVLLHENQLMSMEAPFIFAANSRFSCLGRRHSAEDVYTSGTYKSTFVS